MTPGYSQKDWLMEIKRHFRSMTAFVNAADDGDETIQDRGSREPRYDDWAGGASMADAVGLARTGWPEGRTSIMQLAAELESSLVGSLPIETVTYDVTGDFVDMGRFVSGEPEAMGAIVDSAITRNASRPRIVHMVNNFAASSGVSPESISWRGAGIVAAIHLLERHRIRVRLDLVQAVRAMGTEVYYELRIAAKLPEQPMQIDKLAFCTMHPAMLRRLVFSIEETESAEVREGLGFKTYGGYGAPTTIREAFGDVYIDKLIGNLDRDDTLDWIRQTLQAQGIKISEEARR
jgi:hypothetical protein